MTHDEFRHRLKVITNTLTTDRVEEQVGAIRELAREYPHGIELVELARLDRRYNCFADAFDLTDTLCTRRMNMSEKPILCISTFSSEWDADMARMALDTHGVDSFISKDDGGGTRPYLQPITGVRLMVRSSDAKRASEILKEMKQQDD